MRWPGSSNNFSIKAGLIGAVIIYGTFYICLKSNIPSNTMLIVMIIALIADFAVSFWLDRYFKEQDRKKKYEKEVQ